MISYHIVTWVFYINLDKRNGTSLFPYVVSYENVSFVQIFDILDEFPKNLQFSIEYVKWQKNLANSEVLKLSIMPGKIWNFQQQHQKSQKKIGLLFCTKKKKKKKFPPFV